MKLWKTVMNTLFNRNLIGRLMSFGIGWVALVAVVVPVVAQAAPSSDAIPGHATVFLEAGGAGSRIGIRATRAMSAFLSPTGRPGRLVIVADNGPTRSNSTGKAEESQTTTRKDARGKPSTGKAPPSKGKTRRVCGAPK